MRVLKSVFFRWLITTLLLVFTVINIIACFHAYKFTHYADAAATFPKNPEKLTIREKIAALVFGVNLPRPENIQQPSRKFETISIQNNQLECWEINVENAHGTVLLFHGYGNRKSSMLDRSSAFNKMGYNTVLMDFSGSGGSQGNTTTIGFRESREVKLCYDFYKQKNPDKPVILMGTSMGAAAIMKCVHDSQIQPDAIILECPFGSMYQAVCNRFEAMKVPPFPMAALLVFYGGIMNGFWAFDHNPIDYAKKINCPVLLMCGGNDERVSVRETELIYENLQGEKKKIIYPKSTHESYMNKYAKEWKSDVEGFLNKNLK